MAEQEKPKSGFGNFFNKVKKGASQFADEARHATAEAAAKAQAKVAGAVEIKEDDEFLATLEHMRATQLQISQIVKSSTKLVAKRQEVAEATSSFCEVVGQAPKGNNDAKFGNTLVQFGTTSTQVGESEKEFNKVFTEQFLAPLEALLNNELKEADEKDSEYKVAKSKLEAATGGLEKEKKKAGEGKPAKEAQAQEKVDNASKAYEDSKARIRELVTVIDNKLNEEMQGKVRFFSFHWILACLNRFCS
jgi:RecB family exonuclease